MKPKDERIKWQSSLIIGFGDDLPASCPQINEHTLVICADGGGRWARKWGVDPHIIIGDLDSLTQQEQAYWKGKKIKFLQFSPEKNETDLELAVDYCIGLGITQMKLVGVWGRRIDHSLGNIEILYRLGQENIQAEIRTNDTQLILVGRELNCTLIPNTTISLLPLSPRVTGIHTRGLYYPLIDGTLVKGRTLGISNRVVEPAVQVKTNQGILLAIILSGKSI